MASKNTSLAKKIHENIPCNWYFVSIRTNIFQRFWHRRRFKVIGEMILPVDGTVLDVGSADGVFSQVILKKTRAGKLIGIDVIRDFVDWANKHFKNNKKIHFRVMDADDLKFKNDTFEAIFAMEMLEHVVDPQKVLAQLRRVTKKRGYLMFLIPTDSLLFRVIWYIWTKTRGKIWKDTHLQTYRKDSLEKLCKKAGFQIDEVRTFNLGMLKAIRLKKV